MDNRLCPNPHCGEELSLHQGEGVIEKYCGCCGYESKEKNEIFPSRAPRELRPMPSLAKKRAEKKEQKIKPMRDRGDYVANRGGGRR